VKQQTGAPQHREQSSEAKVGSERVLQTTPPPELSDGAKAVLECLSKAGTGLTVKQLGSRMTYDLADMEDALSELIDRRLVTRLNTIIPSYSFRPPGSRFHAG
jgi:hypothetical protein